MAAFHTDIQLFFRDIFEEDYEDAVLVDAYGHEHYAGDIRLITTIKAMKWEAFGVPYEYCQGHG
ncbi:MAG: hypothetical protein IJ058_13625 [Lachnospiraceae bacterium]|nr:hypothetical protein [Lachnospiraceae bacterium]